MYNSERGAIPPPCRMRRLTFLNPAALIVRTKVEAQTLVTDGLDTSYLVDLGSDAVPSLMAALDEMQPCEARLELANSLLRSGSEGFQQSGADWRSLSWSIARAVHTVDDSKAHLEEIAAGLCG
jgi:hypothetical protein